MKVKQFIELFKHAKILYKHYNPSMNKNIEKEYSDLEFSIHKDKEWITTVKVSNLNEDEIKNNMILNLNVESINRLTGIRQDSLIHDATYLNVTDNVDKEDKKITVGELLNVFKFESSLFISTSHDRVPVSLEIIIKSQQESRRWIWPKVVIEQHGEDMPWGWEILKELEVKGIVEINTLTKNIIRIIAIEE